MNLLLIELNWLLNDWLFSIEFCVFWTNVLGFAQRYVVAHIFVFASTHWPLHCRMHMRFAINQILNSLWHNTAFQWSNAPCINTNSGHLHCPLSLRHLHLCPISLRLPHFVSWCIRHTQITCNIFKSNNQTRLYWCFYETYTKWWSKRSEYRRNFVVMRQLLCIYPHAWREHGRQATATMKKKQFDFLMWND